MNKLFVIPVAIIDDKKKVENKLWMYYCPCPEAALHLAYRRASRYGEGWGIVIGASKIIVKDL